MCPTFPIPLPGRSLDPAAALTHQNLVEVDYPAIRAPSNVSLYSKLCPRQLRFPPQHHFKNRSIKQQHGAQQGIRSLLSGEPSPWYVHSPVNNGTSPPRTNNIARTLCLGCGRQSRAGLPSGPMCFVMLGCARSIKG